MFLIAGVSFLRERTTGTLERLLSTPLKRWEIVIGYVCGFGIFTVVQALLISWFSIQVLGIMMAGSFGYVLLITLLLAITALTLGTLLSAFAGNELQMIQFIPLVIVPQIFERPVPSGYAAAVAAARRPGDSDLLRRPGTDGYYDPRQRLERNFLDAYVLVGFSLLFMILNVLALRKHRRM